MRFALLGAVMSALAWGALHPLRWPWRSVGIGTADTANAAIDHRSRRRWSTQRPLRSVAPCAADEVPVCADLLAVAMAAGCPVAQAIVEVGTHEPVPDAIKAAAGSVQHGNPLDSVLHELGSGGDGWHSLATVLSLGSATGNGGAEALRRLAASERLKSRRERERRARRLPVLLLLPLTTMVLPAFVLATVVPFIVLGSNPLELPPPAPPVPNHPEEGQ